MFLTCLRLIFLYSTSAVRNVETVLIISNSPGRERIYVKAIPIPVSSLIPDYKCCTLVDISILVSELQCIFEHLMCAFMYIHIFSILNLFVSASYNVCVRLVSVDSRCLSAKSYSSKIFYTEFQVLLLFLFLSYIVI